MCAVRAMWSYLEPRRHALMEPLFMRADGRPTTYVDLYVQLGTVLQASGEDRSRFGAHSFRIGSAQALAGAGRSIPYIMSYGRWTCTKSVLRYVKTPEYIRNMDAADMLAASVEHPWNHVLAARRQASGIEDELWCAKQMTFARHQF